MILSVLFLTVASLSSPTPTLSELVDQLSRIERKAYPTPEDRSLFDRLVQQAATQFPAEPATLYWQGIAAERLGESDDAEKYWRRAIQSLQTAPAQDSGLLANCHVRLGYLCLGSDRGAEAERLGHRAVELCPSNLSAIALVTDSSIAIGRLEPALAFLEGVQSQPSAPAESRWIYMELLADVGEWDKLRSILERLGETKQLSPEAQHFRGLLAANRGDAVNELIHHYLAADIGGGYGLLAAKSDRRIQRLLQVDGKTIPSDLLPWLKAIRCQREGEAPSRCDAEIERLKAVTSEQELVAGLLRVRNLLETDRLPDARKLLQRMLKRWSAYVPLLLVAGELAAIDGDIRGSADYLLKAKTIAPDSQGVRDHLRLGLQLAVDPEGVRVVELTSDSPLREIGVQPGDVLLQLDGEPLSDLKPLERLRRVRRFLGGEITYRATTGERITMDLPLLFDERSKP